MIARAIHFAVDAHAGTQRRGKDYPYIIHPLEAMCIVATLTSDPELIAAAVLHDVVEDTDIPLSVIRAEFGSHVADLVATDTHPVHGTWRDTRRAALDNLAHASRDALIVAIGDKLSNLRTIHQDYQTLGDALWSRFHAPNGYTDYAWYYRSLRQALSPLSNTSAYREFSRLVDETFGQNKISE